MGHDRTGRPAVPVLIPLGAVGRAQWEAIKIQKKPRAMPFEG